MNTNVSSIIVLLVKESILEVIQVERLVVKVSGPQIYSTVNLKARCHIVNKAYIVI